MRELTVCQLKFVQLILAGETAKAAYTAAGFRSRGKSAETNAIRLMKKPAVAAAIAAAKATAAEQAGLTAKKVIDELTALGFVDIRKLFHPDGTLKAPGELDPATAAAVASIERTEERRTTTTDKKGNQVEIVTWTTKVKLWDKRLALVDRGKYLGLFKESAAPIPTSDPLAPYAKYTREELEQLHAIARTACERADTQRAA